jgi:hypothetical protein
VNNPWLTLPTNSPFVLKADQQRILGFNSKAKPEHFIHLELLPEPYLGNPSAPIILLNLNPGFSTEDICYHHGNDYFVQTSRADLLHESLEYPFYLLDPKNHASPGSAWWRQKLKPLLNLYGLKRIANELCVIEFFPYHSQHFGCNSRIPSQLYSFYLVQEAMKRNALIIQMRSRKLWQIALPELANYRHYYELNNPQNTVISENNCPKGYPAILNILGS